MNERVRLIAELIDRLLGEKFINLNVTHNKEVTLLKFESNYIGRHDNIKIQIPKVKIKSDIILTYQINCDVERIDNLNMQKMWDVIHSLADKHKF